MKWIAQLCALAATPFIAACTGGATGEVNSTSARMTTYNFDAQSGFADVKTAAANVQYLDMTYTSQNNNDTLQGSAGDVYYSTGFDENVGVVAVSGFYQHPAATVMPPSSGTAVFTGTIGWNGGMNITSSGAAVSYAPFAYSDSITMAADFGNGTLTGSSSSGLITVNSTMQGNALRGSVTFLDVTGTVEGVVSGSSAVGAFQGGGTSATIGNTVFSGGFVVD